MMHILNVLNKKRPKTSQGQDVPKDVLSQGQNVPKTKSQGTKRPKSQMRLII